MSSPFVVHRCFHLRRDVLESLIATRKVCIGCFCLGACSWNFCVFSGRSSLDFVFCLGGVLWNLHLSLGGVRWNLYFSLGGIALKLYVFYCPCSWN
jgi:hypothetical protein